MDSPEVYKKWEPIEGIPACMYLHCLVDNPPQLRLEFLNFDKDGDSSGTQKLIVTFNGYYSYRNTDEMTRLLVSQEVELPNWSLFTIENSHYLNWLHQQSLQITEYKPVIHYLFFTEDELVDVLTEWEPTVICQPVQKPETT